MKMSLLSSKGQITIPREIQQLLKIGHRSRVMLYPQKGVLIVKPLRTSISEQTAGSLKTYIPSKKLAAPSSKVMEVTKRIVAKKLATKG